jgi:hypothetical protein
MSGLFGPYPNSSGSGSSNSGSSGPPIPVPVPPLNPTPGLIKRTAGQTMGGHRAVYVHTDGKLYLADPELRPECVTMITGITPASYIEGSDAYARFTAELTDPSFNFVQGPIYLGPQGTLTQTLPTSGSLVQLGHALGPTSMQVRIEFICNLS